MRTRRALTTGLGAVGLALWSGVAQSQPTEPPAAPAPAPAAEHAPTPPTEPTVAPSTDPERDAPAADAPAAPAPETAAAPVPVEVKPTPPPPASVAMNAPPVVVQTVPVAQAPHTAEMKAALPPAAPVPATAPPAMDPWARPFFVKGDLGSFAIRPTTRRNFVGVGAGVSAVPNDVETALNAFYLTVEPQVDIVSKTNYWRLGLGAPLQFELLDTRTIFEECVAQGRAARARGGNQDEVNIAAASCVKQQESKLGENTGRLRKKDWDEASDFAKVLRYFVVGGQEQPFYLNVSRLYDQSFGHGTVVRDYNANLDYNTARLGATLDLSHQAVGAQAMVNDVVNPDVVGAMAFVRPLRPYADDVFARSLSLGLSFVHGSNQPRELKYERGLFSTAFDQPIPQVDENVKLVGTGHTGVNIIGFDVEGKVVRTRTSDLKLYLDYQRMMSYGGGATAGSLWRFSFGEPATRALRARAELSYFDADYLPSYFDTYHDIFQHQYLPVSYKGSNGLTYHPTKLQYLEASDGGKGRMGGYVEVAHSFINKLTLGMSGRMWRPMGTSNLSLPNYGPGCLDNDGVLTCPQKVTMKSPGYTSMRVFAEVPLQRFLQAFASYEVFSTTGEDGLGALKFDGDNEIFFSGARLMILPIFFVQAEARRYFFLQRLSGVDVSTLAVRQDQSYHANWTFAINASFGYEF